MKIIQMAILALTFGTAATAQTINWAALKPEQRHIISAQVGLDFGLAVQAGYAYQLNTKRPILLNIEQSHPSGKYFFDDFRTKMGIQLPLVQAGGLHITANWQGIFRRYENPFAQLLNFGTELSGAVGYYRPRWYIAGELGFDKAIVTRFEHTDLYKEAFPEVQDGWYEPSTGGNYFYGARAGLSFKKLDLFLKSGQIVAQDFKSKPLLPFYANFGINIRL